MSGALLPLRLEGLSFVAGDRLVVDHITADIAPDRITVVLGHNGAGKSMLMRLCHGLMSPTAGAIRWQGREAASLTAEDIARRQSMVFHLPVLLRRTVRQNLSFPLQLRGVTVAQRRKRVDEVIAETGLGPLADRPARALSAGEQQLAAIARAWVTRPDILFLDEPTTHLDPGAVARAEKILLGIRRAGATIMLATHDLAQARRIADQVLFLAGGRLLEDRPAKDFFTAPLTEEARRFLEGRL
ncbi:MAG: ATP-binding cassette domain-containing protein [Sphingomonadales bacterium]|nr:ATP-binding cassette domain-containing protein [Sphingomonadales bacterium]